MEIIEKLQNEHRFIERVAASFVTYSQMMLPGNNHAKELREYIDFFILYNDAFHHAKEEKILIPGFVEHGIPDHSPPLAIIVAEHRENKTIIDQLKNYSDQYALDNAAILSIQKLGRSYCHNIWEHIDKEDSVLFPETKQRISGQAALMMDKAYLALEENEYDINSIKRLQNQANVLMAKYPPVQSIPEYTRGEGCTNCRHYGIGCQGVEIEWWSEEEWNDFHARHM